MSTQEPGREAEISENPLLVKLVADGDTPNLVTLRGYVGRSTRQDVVTLYPSLDNLSICVDIARSDIVQFTESTEAELPRAGTVLWVKKDTTVTVRSAVQMTAGELRTLRRRAPSLAYGAEMSGTPETPATMRVGRLRIQKPARATGLTGVCTSECNICHSVCNCMTPCFAPPT